MKSFEGFKESVSTSSQDSAVAAHKARDAKGSAVTSGVRGPEYKSRFKRRDWKISLPKFGKGEKKDDKKPTQKKDQKQIAGKSEPKKLSPATSKALSAAKTKGSIAPAKEKPALAAAPQRKALPPAKTGGKTSAQPVSPMSG